MQYFLDYCSQVRTHVGFDRMPETRPTVVFLIFALLSDQPKTPWNQYVLPRPCRLGETYCFTPVCVGVHSTFIIIHFFLHTLKNLSYISHINDFYLNERSACIRGGLAVPRLVLNPVACVGTGFEYKSEFICPSLVNI